ncbi:MAG: SoxY-related AACIE arm protein [Reyranellaceae bacterium]
MRPSTRRGFVIGSAAVALLPLSPAHATPEAMRAAIQAVTRGAKLNTGKVSLDIPPLVENGNAVPLRVTVDSPMTAAEHVRAIHVFNEKNPQPHVLHAMLGPRSGRGFVSTRIKLNDSQRIVAVAELSDGTFWTAGADVVVTLAACVEDLV